VVVDEVLLQGDCDGMLHAYDVSDESRRPRELWTVKLEGCIEATPAVWKGRIFRGTRGGAMYAIGDRRQYNGSRVRPFVGIGHATSHTWPRTAAATP
jgi:hypothetical protein